MIILKKFFTLLSLIILLSWSKPIAAQTVTEESQATSTAIVLEKKNDVSDQEVEAANQILNNLERLVKNTEQKEQLKEEYSDVVEKNRGFIARVVSVKDNTCKVVTFKEEEVLLSPDKSTTLIKRGKSTTGENFTLSEWLNIDDWLVVIGVQSGDVFFPRRIIVSSESLLPEETFVFRAQIKTATAKKVDAYIFNRDQVETFDFSKSTNLVNHLNETISYKDLNINQTVLLIGTIRDGEKTLQTLRTI